MMEAMTKLKSYIEECIVVGIMHKQKIHIAYVFLVTMGEKKKNHTTRRKINFTKCTEHAEQG